MSFWGIEVKPGKPHPYHSDDVQGKLRVTQDIADTESDESSEYDYDDEFDDDDFIIDDNDLHMHSPSPVPNSGVVIEEITEDDKPTKENAKSKRLKKKNNQSSDREDQNNSQRQIVLKRDTCISVLESEDEDGFPISSSAKSKVTVQEPQAELNGQKDEETTRETNKKIAREDNDDATGKKRKVKSVDQDGQPESKTKKKKKQRERGTEEKTNEMDDKEEINIASRDEIKPEEVKEQDATNGNKHDQRGLDTDADSMPGEDSSDKKKKKKKKKKNKTQDSGATTKDQAISAVGGEAKSSLESEDNQSTGKSSQVRTFPNGLVIEELAMGKPDGKRASPGSQVSMHYIGKLKKNGKIFDSNVGRAPFKFRLGVGQVIKGWDVGVNGMRVGDKRRLTIPPSMGYGDRGAGGKIPPNSWLVFDVELANVR
ncbi:unnamed protein product [Dovyalis caffra]|uniref:peptidylprolyl isomerase n=1 Tax=Dovyalis caffra TaxID=77055 RepID=A0AAV1RNW6_9ROSI|nr:unnamed protein product [Dovyalis caffra]